MTKNIDIKIIASDENAKNTDVKNMVSNKAFSYIDPSPFEKKRGRPRKHETLEDYYHACNLKQKLKKLSIEKAKMEIQRYKRSIEELEIFIKENESPKNQEKNAPN